MKRLELLFIFLLCITLCNAQIGYQVSLLNTATGEPRANEKVTAKIELSNSGGKVVYSETQTGVTNDFGVLSLTIGNAQSLSSIDWSNYPMFISVTVDGVLIGKTQVMSVPYANAVVPLNLDLIIGIWTGYKPNRENPVSVTFSSNGLFTYEDGYGNYIGAYYVQGNNIVTIYQDDYKDVRIKVWYYINGNLYSDSNPTLSKR